MQSPLSWLARNRVPSAMPLVCALTFLAQPVAAAGNPQADVTAASQALQQAQARAASEDTALASAQAQLAGATAHLAALETRILSLDAVIASDTATLNTLDQELSQDRGHLADFVRQTYEQGGDEAALVYLISASDIAGAIQRKVQLDHVASAAQQLVQRIRSESQAAQRTLEANAAARQQLAVAEEQARTTQAVIAVQEQQVSNADAAAHANVQQDAAQLKSAQAALARELAQMAALARVRKTNVIYSPVPGANFTVDTDLTQPSGESAARINSFLQGTGLAGLGASFMKAEATYHVSARYFVAHAILESDWGSSDLAQIKHNLFGFGADDANPFGDAATFPSFDACIQYVAQFVAANYLSPAGRYFHGPTLRGMNVDYASDPNWAEKIASIAVTIP